MTPPPPAKKARKAAQVSKATKRGAPKPEPVKPWIEPTGATCPTSHPVKAKLASRIFQLPGMFAYDRTRPDRCYVDSESAIADGFRSAKR